jgi:transcriptional regulator with XRE-family HTH domain
MATAEVGDYHTDVSPRLKLRVPPDHRSPDVEPRQLHRIAEVREEQKVSLRSVARATSTPEHVLRQQEKPASDLTLNELYAWQQALQVPVEDLLVEPQRPLSRPVMERARLLRLMKTAAAIRELSDSERVQRLAHTLAEQLIEVMPELAEVSPWHAVGQRRTLDEYGRAAERTFPDQMLDAWPSDG